MLSIFIFLAIYIIVSYEDTFHCHDRISCYSNSPYYDVFIAMKSSFKQGIVRNEMQVLE